jgi:ubiquinone/menaquinone biosynthesis C-methylase UbiE
MVNFGSKLFLLKDFIDRKIVPGFKIGKNDLVIDIGSGDKPFWRGDVFLDNLRLDNKQRATGKSTIHNLGTFVNGDITKTPFKDKAFDFSFCSHLLEHVQHPDLVINEITRISNRGYIETPNGIFESIFPYRSHLWFVYYANNKLVFVRKSKKMHETLTENGKPYRNLTGKAKNPFIRIYWKKNIPFEIIEDGSILENFEVKNQKEIKQRKKQFDGYMMLVKILRNLFYSQKAKKMYLNEN